MNENIAGPTILVATTTVGVFGALLPDLSDVRRAGPHDVSLAHDVAVAETVSAVVAVGLGALVAALTDSPVPLVAAMLVAGGLMLIYTTILRTVPREVR